MSHLQVGLAVGDTQEESQKANLTKLALQVANHIQITNFQ